MKQEERPSYFCKLQRRHDGIWYTIGWRFEGREVQEPVWQYGGQTYGEARAAVANRFPGDFAFEESDQLPAL